MKYLQLATSFCCLTMILHAQEVPELKFGKVNIQDFQQNYSSIDSSAEAVVLYESGDVDFGADENVFKMIATYHMRYKVLKKSGTDRAIIKIPTIRYNYPHVETISRLEGATYNLENGKIVTTKLNKESIFHEKPVDNRYQEKITMPNVREGSIFEISYQIETPLTLRVNPNMWYFQQDIPVLWSKYTVRIPDVITYRNITGGYLNFLVNKKEPALTNFAYGLNGSAHAYLFVVKDAPAFHNEKFITSKKDYMSSVRFELIGASIPGDFVRNFSDTWENVVKSALKEEVLGEALRQKRFLKEVVQQLQPIKDTIQKINDAFTYISKNIKWNEIKSLAPETDLNKVFENKKGNSAEINIMLINLLKQLGFDANPVILSTRGNGMINELYPMTGQFNFLIAQVNLNGKDLLMDATDPLSRPGLLPEHCLNGLGRLISEKGSRFISLAPQQKRASFEMATVNIDPGTGAITGTISASAKGYEAYMNCRLIKEKSEEEFIKEVKQANSEWQLRNFKLENADDPKELFKMSYDFESPDNVNADMIYLNPMIISRVEDNPFKENIRIYPVDLEFLSDHSYMANIAIPQGYKVAEIPESASVSLPENLGKFTYVVTQNANAVSVSSRILMNEYLFNPDEYVLLKNFYDEIIKKHASQIVFKKI